MKLLNNVRNLTWKKKNFSIGAIKFSTDKIFLRVWYFSIDATRLRLLDTTLFTLRTLFPQKSKVWAEETCHLLVMITHLLPWQFYNSPLIALVTGSCLSCNFRQCRLRKRECFFNSFPKTRFWTMVVFTNKVQVKIGSWTETLCDYDF